MNRNIWVRDEDAELWEWAMAYAKQRRMPVSGVVMMALEEFRERHDTDASR